MTGDPSCMVNPHRDRNRVLNTPHDTHSPEEDAPGPVPGEIIGRKEPPFQATGLDALAPLFRHVDFPATKEEVVEKIGDAVIPIDRQRTSRAEEIIRKTAPDTFRSAQELADAIDRTFHERAPGESRGGHHWQRDGGAR